MRGSGGSVSAMCLLRCPACLRRRFARGLPRAGCGR
nr:MAG TPA: Radical SAM superfamily [Caudoviricetes sp.]